jgi:AcrR family transcriptional regulator
MRAVPTRVSLPRRIDARRNREAILRVAEEAFTEGTEVVNLDEIARRAGLARATVYRHFPDRAALGIAVAAQHLAALKRQRRSLRGLLHTMLSMQVEWRPLVRLFQELPERHQRKYIEALLTVLRPAFDQAQREGNLRDDVELTDLALLFHMLEAALEDGPATVDRAEPAQRLVQVILDGLFGARAG